MLRGVLVPVPTPLTRTERIDVAAVRTLVSWYIDKGVPGLWLLGTIGRFDLVRDAEQRRLVEAVCEFAAGRVELVVNVSDLGAGRTAERARRFGDLPIDAFAVLPPWFRPYSEAEQIGYFMQLADQLPRPLVIYNATWTCNALTPAQLQALAVHERIAGVKDTDPGLTRMQIWPRAEREAHAFSYLHATHLMADSLRLGSDGVVGGLGGVVPELAVAIWRASQNADYAQAALLQVPLLRLASALDAGPDVACLEVMFRERGLCRRISAPPQRALSLAAAALVKRVLREVLTEMRVLTGQAEGPVSKAKAS